MSKILVLGASGTVGSELTTLLRAKHQEVLRATSKKTAAADQVYLNLLTHEGLEHVARADKLFLLSPPGHVNQDELLIPLIDRAKKARVQKIVLMTAMGVDANPEAPLRKVELHLEKSGIPYNIIRPNWFMQNFNTFWLHGIRASGLITLPVGAAKGSFIDARDIAAVARTLLTSDTFVDRHVDLTGPRALDHAEVAGILTQATGRAIGFQDITPEAMLQGLRAAGLPHDYAAFLVMILGHFKAGHAERTTDAVQRITGRPPRSIEQYAQDHRASWI